MCNTGRRPEICKTVINDRQPKRSIFADGLGASPHRRCTQIWRKSRRYRVLKRVTEVRTSAEKSGLESGTISCYFVKCNGNRFV
jgi:hypothetical protein